MLQKTAILSLLIAFGLHGAEPVKVGAGMRGYVIQEGRVHVEGVAAPYTGEVRVPRNNGRTEVRVYHEGWRQGIWQTETAEGVLVMEVVYRANHVDHQATIDRLDKLVVLNEKKIRRPTHNHCGNNPLCGVVLVSPAAIPKGPQIFQSLT